MGDYGRITEHTVGVLLKEMVRRAIETIQASQFSFEVTEKETSYNVGRDFVTSADRAAQAIYMGMIRECLPGYGIIAEEDDLRVPCTLEGQKIWVTVDPLDGTRAFMRRQSQGIGTMVALVTEDEVISAYVGDVITREIYGYRPESPKAHRISRYSIGEELEVDEARPLARQYCLLHTEPGTFSKRAQRLFMSKDRAFGSFEITRGSVGIEFARLWKGEVGGILTLPGVVTPWDFCPLLGISRRLGFAFLAIRDDGLVRVEPPVIRDHHRLDDEFVIVHESRIEEISGSYHE